MSDTIKAYIEVPHNIQNIDNVISHTTYVLHNGQSYAQPCYDIFLETYCDSKNFVYYNANNAVIGSNVITIIEYIKTTD